MRVVIVHGYMSHPEEAWLPWLKAELEKRGHRVALPAMPNPDHPVISEWIDFIAGVVGAPGADTVLVGHSVGCQGILRYLERVGRAGGRVGKTILVAGNFPVTRTAAEADEETDGNTVLRPWFMIGVDAPTVKAAAGHCTVLMSDNDPYIDEPAALNTFRAALDPTIVIVPGAGHFNEDDHLTELPAALAAVLAP